MQNFTGKKYSDLLSTGRELFWKHGFRRVSIAEICSKAGVSKMTFYKYFTGKTELAKAVFAAEVEKGLQEFRTVMQSDVPVKEKVSAMLLYKLERTRNVSREFLQDFYLGQEPDLKQFVDDTTQRAWFELLSEYRYAQKNGIFRDDFKPEFLLLALTKLAELLDDERLVCRYDSMQEVILEFANLMVYGIVNQGNNEICS